MEETIQRTSLEGKRAYTPLFFSLGVLLIILVILIAGMHFRHDPTNTDLWVHLTSGKIIYENKELPTQEILTYTRQGQPWSMHEWLYQLFLYTSYIHIGMTGILFVNTILILFSFALLFIYFKERFYLAIGVLVLLSYLLLISSNIRPHIISWIFLLLTFLSIKQKKEWFLPVLFLFWGNIHPLHLVGLTISFIYLSITFFYTKEKKLLWILLLSIITSTINPSGIKTFLIPFVISFEHINEWQPFSPYGQYFWLYTTFVLIGAYSFFRKKDFTLKSSGADCLTFILLVILGYSSRRHVAQFFIIGLPIIFSNLHDLFDNNLFTIRTVKKNIGVSIILFILLLFSLKYGEGFNPTFDWSKLPLEEVELIQTYNITGNIFNNYAYGSFLEFYLYPHNLVYIDSRAETMGQDLLNEYYDLGTKRKNDIFSVLARDNVTIVIVRHVMGNSNLLLNDPQWKLIYLDGVRASFVLRTNETEQVPELDLEHNPYVTLPN